MFIFGVCWGGRKLSLPSLSVLKLCHCDLKFSTFLQYKSRFVNLLLWNVLLRNYIT